jgi:hypothetical protein
MNLQTEPLPGRDVKHNRTHLRGRRLALQLDITTCESGTLTSRGAEKAVDFDYN